MFSNSMVMTTIPCTNLQRCQDFYVNILGLNAIQSDMAGGVILEAAPGNQIYLYETLSKGGEATRCAFISDDFDSDLSRLKDNGIALEDYELPEIQETAGDTGMMTKIEPGVFSDPTWGKACWFKDPDGNILNLVQSEAALQRAAA